MMKDVIKIYLKMYHGVNLKTNIEMNFWKSNKN